MKVLVACEFSGIVRDAFLKKGHDAMSCDLLPTESEGPHYQGDVMDIINDGWDMMIAHPDCTYLTNAGVRWLTTDPGRFIKMYEAAQFFKKLLKSPIKKKVIENPRPHGYAIVAIGRKYTQKIQPWQFGHTTSKETCLWLKNLPSLKPTNDVYKEMMVLPKNQRNQCHYEPPGPDRWKNRSRTYPGIAEAMAEQWG